MAKTKVVEKPMPTLRGSTKGMTPQELADLFDQIEAEAIRGASFLILQIGAAVPPSLLAHGTRAKPTISATNPKPSPPASTPKDGTPKDAATAKASPNPEWLKLKAQRMAERYCSTKVVQDGIETKPSRQSVEASKGWQEIRLIPSSLGHASTPKGWSLLKLSIWEE